LCARTAGSFKLGSCYDINIALESPEFAVTIVDLSKKTTEAVVPENMASILVFFSKRNSTFLKASLIF